GRKGDLQVVTHGRGGELVGGDPSRGPVGPDGKLDLPPARLRAHHEERGVLADQVVGRDAVHDLRFCVRRGAGDDEFFLGRRHRRGDRDGSRGLGGCRQVARGGGGGGRGRRRGHRPGDVVLGRGAED